MTTSWPTGPAAIGTLALCVAGSALLVRSARGEPQKIHEASSGLGSIARPDQATQRVIEQLLARLSARERSPEASSRTPDGIAVKAARRTNRAAGMLAASVFADSAIEHYRGSFHNKAMYGALISSALSLLASAHGTTDRRSAAHPARDGIYALAALTGLIGTGFHIYNIDKRPGGFSWLNLFYSAPIGAPAALSLSGLLGVAAERMRDNPPGTAPKLLGLPAGRMLAALSATGIAGTVGEVGLLHFRGAYHNPAMFLPVSVPPVAAALLARATLDKTRGDRRFTRWWLRATALLGVVGVGFHAFGVARNMGGWRNWSQNILNGPPLPAPPSFTALALAGLAALDLLEDKSHD